MNNTNRHITHNKGYSLTEILIAITIGLFVSASLLVIFFQNKSSYMLQEAKSRIQENMRFATSTLAKDIRMAGFTGCTNLSEVRPLIFSKDLTLSFNKNTLVEGHSGTGSQNWSPSLPVNLLSNVKSQTDVITIKRTSIANAFLSVSQNDSFEELQLSPNNLAIEHKDILLITDCDASDIFTASADSNSETVTHDTTDNKRSRLSKTYARNSQVMQVEANTFYIKNTNRTNRSGSPIYGLFRTDLRGEVVELVEGIENMKVYYGVDTTADKSNNTFYKADKIENDNLWNKVVSVKIDLLLNSVEITDDASPTYDFDGQTFNNVDELLYKPVSLLINLRNIMP